MKQKRKLGRKLLSFLLTLAMLVGLMPGMGLTAYAADAIEKTVTWTSFTGSGSMSSDGVTLTCQNRIPNARIGGNFYSGRGGFTFSSEGTIKKIVITGFPRTAPSGWTQSGNDYIWTGSSSTVTADFQIYEVSKIVFTIEIVPVTGVNLNKTETTLTAGSTETLTATVEPNNATNKSVTWTSSDNNIATVSNGVVTAKTVGVATITATTNDGNKTATCTVTVNKANPTAPTGLTATYGQILADVTLPTGWMWVDSTQSVGDVVSTAATFKANFAGDDNYNPATNVDVPVTVSPAGINPTVSITGWTYGGDANTPSVDGNTGNGTVTYTYKEKDAEDSTYSVTVPTDAGDYTVRASIAATANYNAASATADFTINKAEVTAPTITSKIYNTELQKADVAQSDLYTVTTNNGGTDVGDYDVVLTLADANNYKWTDSEDAQKTLSFQITKGNAATATVTANNRTYDGTDKPLVNVDDSTLVGGEMYYAVTTENTAPTDENLYTTSIPTAKDAGTYYVWYKVAGDDNHIDSDAACVKVTIAEKKEDSDKKDDTDTVAKPEYKITSGAGASWSKGTTGTLDFTFKRTENDETTYDHFAGVKVDGKTVDAANYEKIKGSVIIKLKSSFLETLETGEHTLTAMFDDADEVTVSFEISAKAKQDDNKQTTVDTPTTKNDTPKKDTPKAPTTGDKINMGIIVMLMIDSTLAALYLTLKRKQIK